ncbi:hypothetical protein FOL47_002388 [Perkinsus chesapeaki]|uniref:Uncharacterized protein n=1 Tax=Perkinsus chesapeaki TaxID=330153 RepID=A0A7J6KPX9_PERCH|nr:hypothetical protein FOL47_002388 [Perkinsus chesapeaki]
MVAQNPPRSSPDICPSWRRPQTFDGEGADQQLEKSILDACEALKKLPPEALREKTGLPGLPWEIKDVWSVLHSVKAVIDRNVATDKMSRVSGNILLSFVLELSIRLGEELDKCKILNSEIDVCKTSKNSKSVVAGPSSSNTYRTRRRMSQVEEADFVSLSSEAAEEVDMELERFADRGHEPASGNWVNTRPRRQTKARDRPVRPAIGSVDLGEAQTGNVPSVKRKNDFVVMVIDKKWVYSTSRALDASRRQQTLDSANLPLVKKEEVLSVLKGKGFKVDLFQTARGTGVGCQSPQERDKVLEYLIKEKGSMWDVRKDLPRMRDIKLVGHGYEATENDKLIDDFKTLNGIEAPEDAIRVLRMTDKVVFLRLSYSVFKGLPERIYLDCVRLRPIPVTYRSICYRCGSRDSRHDHRSCAEPQICRICSSTEHLAIDCDKPSVSYEEKAFCKFCCMKGHGPFDVGRCQYVPKRQLIDGELNMNE